LTDKQGETYEGYITFDKTNGKTNFSLNQSIKSNEQINSAEDQNKKLALNSEEKSNETMQTIKEPLKAGPGEMGNKKHKDQQEASKIVVKTSGRKI
jgi:hypothetical protein